MSRVVHFEIHATEPELLIEFYRSVFAWRFRAHDGPEAYWFITTGPADEPGIDGGLVRRDVRATSNPAGCRSFVCTVQVRDVDESCARIQRFGGRVVVQRFAVPGHGWMAHAEDPDGNQFSVIQKDRGAGARGTADAEDPRPSEGAPGS